MSHPYGQQPPPYQGPGQPGPQQPGQQQPGPQQPYQPQGYGSMPPAQPQGYGSMPPVHADQAKGFFGSLFDFSFTSFVTPKIVKLVYVVSTVALVLLYLVIVITSFSQSPGLGVLVLLFGAPVGIVYLAFIRMTLEFYYAIVRMSEDINRRLPKA